MTDKNEIRFFEPKDVPALLLLMKELALLEGYLEDFAITEQYLIEHGFGNKPLFQVLVAQKNDDIVGYGAFYSVPFTFKGRPKVVLKELYLAQEARGHGIGKMLFDRLKEVAITQRAYAIEWLVLDNNLAAQFFYGKRQAKVDEKWQRWSVTL